MAKLVFCPRQISLGQAKKKVLKFCPSLRAKESVLQLCNSGVQLQHHWAIACFHREKKVANEGQ